MRLWHIHTVGFMQKNEKNYLINSKTENIQLSINVLSQNNIEHIITILQIMQS